VGFLTGHLGGFTPKKLLGVSAQVSQPWYLFCYF